MGRALGGACFSVPSCESGSREMGFLRPWVSADSFSSPLVFWQVLAWKLLSSRILEASVRRVVAFVVAGEEGRAAAAPDSAYVSCSFVLNLVGIFSS